MEPPILILCHRDDELSLAVYRYLMSIHVPVEIHTAEELIYARSWNQHILEHGNVSTSITLLNGQTISSDRLSLVFNRIQYFFMPHFLDCTDRTYAEMEMYALYISFLQGIQDRLLEPLAMRYLSPAQDNSLYFYQKAVETHVPVLDFHFTSSPRHYPSPGLMPYEPPRSTLSAHPQRSEYLVWENHPTLFLQPFTTLMTISVIGNTIISDEKIPFEKEMKKFAASIGKYFIELQFVKTRKGIRLHQVNIFPRLTRWDIITTLAAHMAEIYRGKE